MIDADTIARLAAEPCRAETETEAYCTDDQPCRPCLARRVQELERTEGLVFDNMAEHCDAATADLRERADRLERAVDEIVRAWRGGSTSRAVLLLEDLCDGNEARRALGEEE